MAQRMRSRHAPNLFGGTYYGAHLLLIHTVRGRHTWLPSSCYCRCDMRVWRAAAALAAPCAASLASFAFWKRSQKKRITPSRPASPLSPASGIRHVASWSVSHDGSQVGSVVLAMAD